MKFILGLFDSPYQKDLQSADREVNSKENQQIALQASRESIVLLKNKNNTLPLDIAKLKRVAVIGPNACEKSFALTHYGPLAVEVTTVLDGVTQKAAKHDVEVKYEKGCDLVDARWPESEIIQYPLTDQEKSEINAAVKLTSESDVAIVVLGGGVRTCGENKSRSDITLPGRQLDLLQAVQATGKPTIVVLINGRPLAVNWAQENVDAILEAWYPGSQGGTAIADVVFGDYNPGGKLTVTFPKTVGQIPFNFPSRPFAQVDCGNKPGPDGNQSHVNGALYPFGYGLSYTTFAYSDLTLSAPAITPNQELTVSFKVKNTGTRAGDEVVQLYVRDVVSSIITYEKDLKGFDRVHLQPGEEKLVIMKIKPEELALLNRHLEWVVEPGDFKIMIGASSTDIRLNATVTVVDKLINTPVAKDKNAPVIIGSINNAQVKAVADNNPATAWTILPGEHVTISLPQDSKPGQLDVIWGKYTKGSEFEIQLSSGGGQFLTVYKGRISGEALQAMQYKFNRTPASDLRVLLRSGKADIAEIKL